MEQIVKLDGLPEAADQIIRQQRDTDERIAAGFANMARFAAQFDRIEKLPYGSRPRSNASRSRFAGLPRAIMSTAMRLGK